MSIVEPARDGVQIVLRQHSAANGNYVQPFESVSDLFGLVVIASQTAVDLKKVYHSVRESFFFQGIFKEGEVHYGRSCGVHHWRIDGQQWINMFMPRIIEVTGMPFEAWHIINDPFAPNEKLQIPNRSLNQSMGIARIPLVRMRPMPMCLTSVSTFARPRAGADGAVPHRR